MGYQSYNWIVTGPNSFLSNLSGENTSVILTEIGSYDVTLTVSDGVISETSTQFGFLSVQTIPIINAVSDQTVCHNEFIQEVYFSGSTPNAIYQWTHSNQAIGLSPSAGVGSIPPFQVQNLTSVVINSIFTVIPVLNGCSGDPIIFNITVKPIPTVFSTPNQTHCHNDSTLAVNFSGAINGTDYNWANNNPLIGCVASGTGDIPSFQVQSLAFSSQIASFIVTPSLNGCLGSAINFDITVLPLPIVNAGNDTVLCVGQSYTPIASGSPLANFFWSNNVSNGVPFIPNSTILLTLSAQLNGCTASDVVALTVLPIPTISITSFNGEDSLACDGSLSVTVVGGVAPYTYLWTNGSGDFTTPIIENLCSGIYNITVTDANGCMVSNSGVVNDTLIPILTGDTLIFTDNIYPDSTIIGSETSDWIENCTFDYDLVTAATINSYVDNGSSTIVTWLMSLSDGTIIPIEAIYNLSPGTAGVYELTLQLTCSQKSDPKFLIANSRLYYEGSTIGIQTNSLSAMHLYPNPAISTIFISGLNEEFNYEIRDLQGKLVQQGTNAKQIKIEDFPTGTYLIGVSRDNEVKQLRFVKF